MNNSEFSIITFYQFKKINNLKKIEKLLKDLCFFHKIRGTVLIAEEGINGTLAGFVKSVDIIEKKLIDLGFAKLQLKKSSYPYMPFNRFKIKIKREIVTFDGNDYKVHKSTATHVDNIKWNKLIEAKNTIVIDVRNDFECKIGSFKGSINPRTKSFSGFKKFINNSLNKYKEKKIALYCTGGIRCEKASSYMIQKGFKKVYQLNGGILKYLEEVSKSQSMWNGECFVFDNRVTVKMKLSKGTYSLCHACRYPISHKDKKSIKFEKGVSCPNCHDKLSIRKKNNLKERNKQIKISKKRGLYNPYIKLTPLDF
tara:strand:+ start:38 stop:970 length:933 start_codon:yes stop_codon:yes gene_type:complete